MADEVTYRRATAADIPAALALWRVAGAHPTVSDSAQSLDLLLRHDGGALLLAVRGEEVVGTLLAAWNGWRGGLYRLAVHPAVRRHGVARELVRRGVDRLRDLGAQRIDALVVAADADAVAFWDALRGDGIGRDPLPKLRFVMTAEPGGG